jgi:hypothetical protein
MAVLFCLYGIIQLIVGRSDLAEYTKITGNRGSNAVYMLVNQW